MIEKAYNVGIYCRLSNDDERDGESVSIENQKLLLQRYVRKRGWNEVDCIFTANYLPNLGGVERYTYNLAKKLTAQGNKVTVL